jgi:hypothetical protein
MKKIISLLFMLQWFFIISCTCNSDNSRTFDSSNEDHIVGSYASISESEWHQILKLSKYGNAELTTISWYPGEVNNAKEKRVKLSWSYEHPYLKLKFVDNKIEIFKYIENVEFSDHPSYAYFKIKGTISVLEKTENKKESKIYEDLWQEPIRTKFVEKMYEKAIRD